MYAKAIYSRVIVLKLSQYIDHQVDDMPHEYPFQNQDNENRFHITSVKTPEQVCFFRSVFHPA